MATLQTVAYSAGNKILPTDTLSGSSIIDLAGCLGEGVAGQVVLRSPTAESGLSIAFTPLTSGAATFPADAIFLYLVKYIPIAMASDTDPNTGAKPPVATLWPDPLLPLGKDASIGVQRLSTFSLAPNENQPMWIDVRIPPNVNPGTYTGALLVSQGANVVASVSASLKVWAFSLEARSIRPAMVGLTPSAMYYAHIQNGNIPPAEEVLIERYLAEGYAHRLTLNPKGQAGHVAYTFDGTTATVSPATWSQWDQQLQDPRATSYPLPLPGALPSNFNNPNVAWTAAMMTEATALWSATDAHYAANGWLPQSYFYCFDEPANTDAYSLVISQSQALARTNDPPLRGLVTSDFDAVIAQSGNIGIWVPNVVGMPDPSGVWSTYSAERAKGARIWWYDSNQSRFMVQLSAGGAYIGGVYPDHFIDHGGANELVRGPLSYLYGFDGYLYYEAVQGYATHGQDVWNDNFQFDCNGDGTLFYPGAPSVIGGPSGSDIPVPSIRLQLFRTAWTTFELLLKLDSLGHGLVARGLAANCVTNATQWNPDPDAYEKLRRDVSNEIVTAYHGG